MSAITASHSINVILLLLPYEVLVKIKFKSYMKHLAKCLAIICTQKVVAFLINKFFILIILIYFSIFLSGI